MQYELTEEQIMIQETARRLSKEKIAPGAAERDEREEFPWDVVEVFRENGLFGADFPEQYGGSDMGLFSLCLATEEVAKVCASSSVILMAHELGVMPIFLTGNEEQKQKYLPSLATGENLIAFGLTEPNAGSDVSGIQTRAIRDGDSFVLNGRKIFISHGDVAKWICVTCRQTPDVPASKGLAVIIVENGTPGLVIGKKEKKMGIRASSTVELIFEDCRVPAENLIGEENHGFPIAMKTFDFTRIPVAAQGLGIAQGAFDYALAYIKERRQFGRPLISFQGLQFMFADMATKIEAARQLTYKAALIFEKQKKDLSRLPVEAVRLSSMCKMLATDTAMEVTTNAVQALGGYGYIKEYPLERMMRDAKITQIYEGTSQIQKLIIASTL